MNLYNWTTLLDKRWGSLLGCRLWGRTESDTTEVTQQHKLTIRQYKIKILKTLVGVLPPGPWECHYLEGLCRCNQVKMMLLGRAPVQPARHVYRKWVMWTWTHMRRRTQRQRGDRHVRMKADIRGAATSQGMPGASRSWKTQGKILP